MKTSKLIRNVILFVGILYLVWFIAPFAIYGILNAGNIAGMLASIIIILYGVFFKRINLFLKEKKLLLYLVLSALLTVIIFKTYASIKIVSAFENLPDKETTVVVLGCQVKPYGPSLMLLERLETAEKFLKENPYLKCVLSGGQGKDEPISEAQAMYEWLVSRGIDKERLFIEDKSTSTEENITFTKKVIEENGLISDITIVTNEFHQYRAREIARKQSIESYSVSGKTLITFFPTYFLREIGGVLFELLRSIL